MWCPDGYAIFEEVHESIGRLIGDAIPWDPGTDIMPILSKRAHFSDMALESFFYRCPSLSVVSPLGQVVRVSYRITALRRFQGVSCGYSFLNSKNWTVDTRQVAQTIQSLGSQIDQGFEFLRIASTNSPEQDEERLEAAMLKMDEELAATFSCFQGWALTCKLGDIPADLSYFPSIRKQILGEEEVTSQASLDQNMLQALRCMGQLGRLSKERVRRIWFSGEKTAVFLDVWREMGRRFPDLPIPGPRPNISDRDIESFIRIDSETNSCFDSEM